MNKFAYFLFLSLMVSAAGGQTFPLKKSANGRYLVDQNNVPFQIRGDGCWGIATGLDSVQMRAFLLNRKAKGFNTVLLEVVNHFYTSYAPNNAYNVGPFTAPGDFSTPNPAYFKTLDVFFRVADSLKMLLLPIPAYFGYPGTEEGWDTEISSSGNAKMKAYGRYLGGRYGKYENIIWLMGGDRNPSEAEMVSIDSLRNGIRDSMSTLLFGLDTFPGTSAVDAMRGRTWLWINDTYNYGASFGHPPVWQACQTDYTRPTVLPFFLKESYAEQIHQGASWTTTDLQMVRSANWWSILSGACGSLYMNDQWCFFEPAYWAGAMESSGSLQSSYCWNFFEQRNWWTLVPDNSHLVMTAGYGSGTTYATASYASDSTTIVAYLPSNRQVTVNTNYLRAGRKVIAQWFNPVTGVYSSIGTYDRTGSQAFMPVGSQDWVLVLDSDPATGVGNERPPRLPRRHSLLPNYPNPFNPGTRIQYDVAVRARVRLTVTDILGRSVAILQDGWQEPGTYTISFDGNGLPAGVYLCTMTAGDWSSTQKLLLVR